MYWTFVKEKINGNGDMLYMGQEMTSTFLYHDILQELIDHYEYNHEIIEKWAIHNS